MEKNCNLPNCNCDSPDIPVDISKYYKTIDLPQLVVLTIDDDKLDIKSYQVYKKLLESFKNPDNSSIKVTFFVSDSVNKTSFCLLRNLYEKNHEIAISTRNYTCPNKRCSTEKDFQPWDYQQWTTEILMTCCCNSNPAQYESNRRLGHLVYVLGRTADGAKLPYERLRLNASKSDSHLNLQRYFRRSYVIRYR
jgi:hypothetical protein